jgi:hypothetical protein
LEINLQIAGLVQIALALIHGAFPKRFRWKEEFASVSLLSRQIMYVHTLFVALVVFLMGVLCFTSAPDLISTSLGKRVCLGLGVFWGLRLAIQFFGYSSELWRGKRLETSIHIIFSILWVYLTATFFVTLLS